MCLKIVESLTLFIDCKRELVVEGVNGDILLKALLNVSPGHPSQQQAVDTMQAVLKDLTCIAAYAHWVLITP